MSEERKEAIEAEAQENAKEPAAPKESEPPVFTKQQLLEASRYREKRDLLQVLLEDGRKYSFLDVEKLMKRYLKGKVK